MQKRELVTLLSKEKHISIEEIGRRLGYRPCTLGNGLRTRRSINVSNYCRILSVLGYKIIAVPRGTAMRDNWYKID